MIKSKKEISIKNKKISQIKIRAMTISYKKIFKKIHNMSIKNRTSIINI